ncbi:MAG: undecaprenyl-diphosphate phosphatase [Deltaproteobacteria bacterium]|nr:undecaprenyl-diphosphate phosphatase [Deltaproteobacteria bacterium]
MEILWITLLGVVQGATEFLPVSSSGHLAAGQLLIARVQPGTSLAAQPLTLEILLHLATFLAVIVYFRREVWAGLQGGGRGAIGLLKGNLGKLAKEDDGVNLALAVVVGTIPTAIIGLFMKNPASIVSESPVSLGFSFIGCACLLFASRWWPGGRRRLSLRIALLIGLVQGIAVIPGISRSGATIAVGLALGLEREDAARFSFLLSLPAILGAALLELDFESLGADENTIAYLLGGIAAFAVGLAALHLLIRLVRSGRFWLFAPYVGAVGVMTMFAL